MPKQDRIAPGRGKTRPKETGGRARRSFKASSEGVMVIEADTGQITEVNPSLGKMVGCTPDELLHKNLWEIDLFQDAAAVKAALNKMRPPQHIRWGALALHHKAGGTLEVEFIGSACEVDHRRVIRCILVDLAGCKETAQAGRRSEEPYRSTMDRMLEGCQIIGHDWCYVYINDAAERHNRRPRGELIGRRYMDMWPGIESTHVFSVIRRCMEGHSAEVLENEFVFPDGMVGWFVLSIQPVPEGVFILSMDITARKRMEAALRGSEELFKTIASSTPDHLLVQDHDLRYTYVVNPQLGLTEQDMLGKTDWEILRKQDAEQLAGIKRRVLENGETVHIELPMVSLSGEEQFFDGSYVPKYDAHGAIDGLIGYFRNVTALKKAEVALRASEERFHSLFDAMNEGFCVIEVIFDTRDQPLDYRFLEINAAFEKQTGLHAAQGKLIRDLAPENEDYWFQIYGKVALTGEPARFVNEARALGRWFEVFAYRVGRPEDRQVAIIFNDITERKRDEQDLNRLNRILRALSNSKQAIMQARNETEYMNAVCQIVVNDCGHAMVWIGMAEQDEGKTVRPVACAGFEDGYLETLKITWADTKRGRGPTGTAIRTGKPSMCRDMLTDPKFAPWRAEAVKRGYASSLVLPLMTEARPLGAITIYSRQPDFFPDSEVRLLTELANDLANGITSFRLRADRARAEEELEKSEERYRALVENAPLGIGMAAPDGKILAANDALLKILGYTRDDFLRLNMSQIYRDPVNRQRLVKRLQKDRRAVNEKLTLLRKDGTEILASVSAAIFPWWTGEALLAVVEDIGERVRFEEMRNWLASFPEFNPSPIVEVDFNGKVRYINPTARRLFPDLEARGMQSAWLSGLESFFDRFRAGTSLTAVRDVRVGSSTYQQQLHCLLGDGRVRIYGFDITARDRAEEALRQAHSELEQRVRDRTRELNQTNEQLKVEIEERRQLAQNLHDAVNQSLFSAGLIAEVLPRLAERDPDAARQSLEDLRRLTRGAQAELRALLAELKPSVLAEADLGDLLRQLANAFTGRTNIPVAITVEGRALLPARVQVALYRMCQEGLSNIAKHAEASQVWLEVRRDAGGVELRLCDNGRGFDPRQPLPAGHYGLGMMRDHADAISASLDIKSRPGHGTEVVIGWKQSTG